MNDHGVWIRDQSGTVHRIDPDTSDVVARIDTDGGGSGIAAGPDAVWVPGTSTGIVSRIDPETNAVEAEIDISAAVGESTDLAGIHYVDGSVWSRFNYCIGEGDAVDCRRGIARIDPATNEVVAVELLRSGWRNSGMSAGPNTAWTYDDDAIARIDP